MNDSKPSKDRGATTDWNAVIADAKEFRTKYPDHPQSRSAAKVELIATIRAEDARSELSASTLQGVGAFLSDSANPARDRLEVKITFEQAKSRRKSYASRNERLQAQSTHAQELIAEFPDQPEGYGYQLSLAKGASPDNARLMANELLAASAPEAFKAGAQRVLARLDLEGQPLTVNGAELAIARAKGFLLVVYSWSAKDRGFLNFVKHLTRRGDVRFIGVNLDKDQAAARAMAAALGAPGTQLYDGNGLDGPAARQLNLVMTASLYIVDKEGVVRDVNGHQDLQAKLGELALEKGGDQ